MNEPLIRLGSSKHPTSHVNYKSTIHTVCMRHHFINGLKGVCKAPSKCKKQIIHFVANNPKVKSSNEAFYMIKNRFSLIWTLLHSSVSVVSSRPSVLMLKTPVVVSMIVVIKSCVKNKIILSADLSYFTLPPKFGRFHPLYSQIRC